MTETATLPERIAALITDTTDADLAEALRDFSRHVYRQQVEADRRAAEIAEMYRPATEEELATLDGIRHYLCRLKPEVGPAALPGLLQPVQEALARMGYVPSAIALRNAAAICGTRSASYVSIFLDLALGRLRP